MQKKWWEETDDEVVQPAQPITVAPADPRRPIQTQRESVGLQADQVKLAREQAELERLRQQPDPTDVNPADPKNRQRLANLKSLANQLDRVEELYRQDIAPTSGLGGIADYFPTEANRRFDAAAAGLAEQGLAAFRVPGVGAQSDTELRQFTQANRPSASDYDTTIEEKMRQLRVRLDATLAQYGLPPSGQQQQQEERRDAAPVVTGQQPPPAAPGGPGMDRSSRITGPGGGDQVSLAKGEFKRENDPALAGMNDQIRKMIVGGASAKQILDYYRANGGTNPLDMRSLQEAINWQRRTRSKTGPDVDVDNRMVPLTGVQQFMNNAAQSPLGAYSIGAADTLTGGTLDNMTGNPALARMGMDQVAAQNPNATLAGNVTGGALASGAAEFGAAGALSRIPALSRFTKAAPLMGDAAYGGAYGAGSTDEGSRLYGALKGAAAGVGGGVAGRKVASATGRALTGSRDAATRLLRERGIPQTIGDIAGRGGMIGKGVKRMENALESVPILGSAISRRRAEGVEGFNRAAFREALEPIPPAAVSSIAEEGVQQAQSAVSGAYDDALRGARVALADDGLFARDMTRAAAAGNKLHKETKEAFTKLVANEIAPEMADGTLTGEGYQTLRRILREERAAWKSNPRGRQYGNALRQLETALEAAVRRQAPEVVEGLNRADAAYRKTGIVRAAVSSGMNNNAGGVFTPAQLGRAAENNAKKFGGKNATTERPFYELQRAAQDVLPSQVPNSGTADRLMAGALLPALPGLAGAGAAQAGLIDPETAALMASLGLPYTKAGREALERILIDRPDLLRRGGQKILDRKQIGGLFGAGAAAGALPAQ